MSARSVMALICFGAAAVAAGQTPGSAPGSAPASAPETRSLAVTGLVHTALSVGHSDASRSLAGLRRIRALLHCAEQLDPEDVGVNRELLGYYQQLGRLKADLIDRDHVKAVGHRYMAASPDDYAMGMQWVQWSQIGLNESGEKIKVLDDILGDGRLSKAIRSAAAVDACGIYLRQSDQERAKGALAMARELDPYGPGVAELGAQFETEPTVGQLLQRRLDMLRGDPRGLGAAWTVATMLQAVGLHTEALPYFRHARELLAAKPPDEGSRQRFMANYADVLLDAGRPAEIVQEFEPLMDDIGGSVAVRALMVEACRDMGAPAKADAHVRAIAEAYAPLIKATARTANQAANVALFYLIFDPKPDEALKWAKEAQAKEAQAKDPQDPFVLCVLGMAEVATGQGTAGAEHLRPLAAKDAHAAAALVKYYAGAAQKDEAAAVVAEAARDLRRTGPGWRSLAKAARDAGIPIPPAPEAEAASQALAKQPDSVLKMGSAPQEFVRVAVRAPRSQVAPGDPVELTIELTNISDQPVPLGWWGVFNPTVFVSVDLAGSLTKQFPNLRSVTLPAPRYLQPGASVSRTVRLDVGPLDAVLAPRPLEAIDLTVTTVLDPLQVGQKLVSSVPQIVTPEVRIRRAALFEKANAPNAAKVALGLIVRDLRRGGVADQVAAARRTASLLAHVRNVEMGKATAVVPEVIGKPILLSMTRAFLRHETPVVRAEMLAALHTVPLDPSIISLTAPCVRDPDPLVRMRLIELLAGQRTRGYETLLQMYARDGDPCVREMASALSKQ